MSSYPHHSSKFFIFKMFTFYYMYFQTVLTVVKWTYKRLESNIFHTLNFFFTLEYAKNYLKTFFHCTWNFFLLTVKSETFCENILPKSKMFLHIFKLFIRCFVPIKMQNCHGWKKTAFFFTRDTMKIIIRQDLSRLLLNQLSCFRRQHLRP